MSLLAKIIPPRTTEVEHQMAEYEAERRDAVIDRLVRELRAELALLQTLPPRKDSPT